jgi:hypothetical protein
MSEQQVTNATIMREYFKTGVKPGKRSKVFGLVDFANEYSSYVTHGHIQERNGRHRQVFSWPELVRQQRERVALKAERLARRNAA